MVYKSINQYYITDPVLLRKLCALTTHPHHINRELACPCYENALVQPFKIHHGTFGGGVLTSDDFQIANTGYHEYVHKAYEYAHSDVNIRHEQAIYIGCIYQCWGHLFTDGFAKLWFLNTEKCKVFLQQGYKVIYITKNNEPLPQYVFELFNLAGIDIQSFEHITKHTRFDSIYIPDNSFYLQLEPYERMFTDEYLSIIQLIRDKFAHRRGNYPEKIYLTRTKLGQDKRDYGEPQIEKIMQQAGYTIIAPEQYSVEEQIDFMVHCKYLAATEGSISLSSLFCQPGTELIVIKKGAYTNGYQAAVADAARLVVTYVESYKSTYNNKEYPWMGPFFIYPNNNLLQAIGAKKRRKILILNREWLRYHWENNPLKSSFSKIKHSIRNQLVC